MASVFSPDTTPTIQNALVSSKPIIYYKNRTSQWLTPCPDLEIDAVVEPSLAVVEPSETASLEVHCRAKQRSEPGSPSSSAVVEPLEAARLEVFHRLADSGGKQGIVAWGPVDFILCYFSIPAARSSNWASPTHGVCPLSVND